MKKILPVILVAFSSLLLFGCPYESQVPVGKPEIPVDKRFVGNWRSDDESYNQYVVSVKSPVEYAILQKNSVGGVSKFTGYLSDVKNAMFMNLYSDSTKSYYIYRINFDAGGDKFTLMPVAEDLPEHFGSSEALRNYVEKHMNLQSFYNAADKSDFYKAQ